MLTRSFSVVAVCLALLRRSAGAPQPQLSYDIPAAEYSALAEIVEDDPADVFPNYVPIPDEGVPDAVPPPADYEGPPIVERDSAVALSRRDDESPPYNKIYQVALPIPPVKQPLM
jgi:hypothetical protein